MGINRLSISEQPKPIDLLRRVLAHCRAFLAIAALAAVSVLVVPISPFPVVASEPAPAFDSDSLSAEVEEDREPAVVLAGRVAGDKTSTRFYFDLDRKVEFDTFLMADPGRVVIEGPTLDFRFENPDDLEPRGLISFLRYGAKGRYRSRIVISLAEPAEIVAMTMQEMGPDGRHRLTIDLAATSAEKFDAAVERQQTLLGRSGETAVKGDRIRPAEKKEGRFVVVIDPGHGGIDGGAKGAGGTQEKDLTLAVARRLADRIAASGPFDVRMTRESDVFLSLRERVRFAERQQADLFVSIHADSLRQKWVRGASVYTLSEKASDDLAEQLAESENMTDIIAGLDNPEEEEVVNSILAELTARETKRYSLVFASMLANKLATGIRLIKNPQRSAGFMVLKAPEIPGVLLELGYLSNTDDEKQLTDEAWQDQAARLVADAILAFFGPRLRQQ